MNSIKGGNSTFGYIFTLPLQYYQSTFLLPFVLPEQLSGNYLDYKARHNLGWGLEQGIAVVDSSKVLEVIQLMSSFDSQHIYTAHQWSQRDSLGRVVVL